jgi:hypothetical protein
MHHIQKVSTYFIWLFNLLLIVIPVLALSYWVLLDWEPFRYLTLQGLFSDNPIITPEGPVKLSHLKLTPLSLSIGILGSLLYSLPIFLGVLVLKHLFQNYKKGVIFSPKNVKNYKYLGWILFLDALFVKPIGNMLLILAATLSNAPGHRYISISFGTPSLESIFYGLLIIVISWIMAEGYKLQEEQNLTI